MHTKAAAIVIYMTLVGCAAHLERTAPPPRAVSLIDGALAMLGQPYRYGGAAPGGFDCSGLVAYAGAEAGLHLPRTAAQQLHAGVAIKRREVRAGDLVFLHLAGRELHVGIALDGSRFVHAPSTGGHVRIDSIDTPFYARRFVNARRVVPDPVRSGAT